MNNIRSMLVILIAFTCITARAAQAPKEVEVVNEVDVTGTVDANINGPVDVNVLTLPADNDDGAIEGMFQVRLKCSYVRSTFVTSCNDSFTTFSPGTKLLIYSVDGVVSHTADGNGDDASGLPGGLCEGNVKAGALWLAIIQVQPGQSQFISREFNPPFKINVIPSLNLDLSSGFTGGGSCAGHVEVVYKLVQ